MRSAKFAAFLLFAAIVPIGQKAHADTIAVGGPWLEFAYADSGTPAFGCDGACIPSSGGDSIEAGDPAWTFTSTVPVTVTITDAFFSGNSFELFDGSTLIGSTPSIDIGYSSCGSDIDGSDPAACSMDPSFSNGVFSLGAGDHSLTIDALDSPFGGGAAYFRVDSAAATSPVPEPTTALLVLSGALALCGILTRHSSGVNLNPGEHPTVTHPWLLVSSRCHRKFL